MVFRLIASSDVVAFAVFRAFEKMEMETYLVDVMNSRTPAGYQLSHR